MVRPWPMLLGLVLGGSCLAPEQARPLPQAEARFEQWDRESLPLDGSELIGWWNRFADESWSALVSTALERNQDLLVADARVRRARALAGRADSDLWPAVDGVGAVRRERIPGAALGPFAPEGFQRDLYQLGAEASWELDLFGGQRAQRDAARAQWAAQVAERVGTQVRVAAEVGRALLEWRAAAERIRVLEAQLKAREQTLALGRERSRIGLVGDLDVLALEAAVDDAAARLPPLRLAREVARERLRVLVGGGTLGDPELGGELPLPAAIEGPEVGLPAQLLQRRPDLLRASLESQAARARVDAARVEYLPQFSLTGTLGWQSAGASDLLDGDNRAWSLGPGVRWRLLDFGRVESEVEVTRAELDMQAAMLQALLLTAVEEVEGALARGRHLSQQVELLMRARASALELLALTEVRYGEGLVDYSAVLDAQVRAQSAEDDWIVARAAHLQSQIDLFRALGGGF